MYHAWVILRNWAFLCCHTCTYQSARIVLTLLSVHIKLSTCNVLLKYFCTVLLLPHNCTMRCYLCWGTRVNITLIICVVVKLMWQSLVSFIKGGNTYCQNDSLSKKVSIFIFISKGRLYWIINYTVFIMNFCFHGHIPTDNCHSNLSLT